MQTQNPFDQFDAPAGRVIVTKPADPKMPYEGALAQSELASARARAVEAAAKAPYQSGMAADAASIQHSQAIDARAKSDAGAAERAASTMSANSQIHGEAYLQKYVPVQQQALVRAYARGDLGSRSGGLSTSMLPIIQHAMNFDPSASAANFPARVKMQSDLAGNQPGTAGGSLRAMEQMVLHGSNVLATGQSLDNYGPGVLGHLGNMARIGYMGAADDPTLNAYRQEVKNYAPESQKGVAGAAGIGAEREERAAGYAPSSSQAARAAALQADARMAMERMGAVNDQYKRLMGKDITDQMSPVAKAAYDKIMAGGYDKNGKPLYPVAGYAPISGNGPGGGTLPPGLQGPSGSGLGPMGIATGTTRTEADPSRQGVAAKFSQMMATGVPDAQIRAFGQQYGATVDSVEQALKLRRANPRMNFDASKLELHEVPQTMLNRASASSYAGGVVGALDGATAGFLDEGVGLANSALTGRPASETIAEANRGKQEIANASPIASLIGNAIGTTGAYMAGGAGLAKLGLPAMGKLGGYAGSAALGALTGAGEDNNNRLGGAAIGGITGAIGQGLGEAASVPLGALARTQPVSRVLGMFGRGPLSRVAAPSPATKALVSTATKAGPGAIGASLDEASRLGVPMTLADTHASLGSLAGAAGRVSPAARQVAEDVLLPRGRGQIDRLSQAVTRDLGPIGNIPQMSADLTQQARTAAGPLYDQAYRAPVVSTPQLDATLNTPFGRQAMGRAQTIAANEGRSPSELGFALDEQGNTVLNPRPNPAIANHLGARAELDAAQQAYRDAKTGSGDMGAATARIQAAREALRKADTTLSRAPDPSVAASVPGYTTQTLDYVKRGMDDVLEQYRNPVTNRLELNDAGRAQNGVKNDLLGHMDTLNPAYGQARAAYAGPVQARDAMARGQDAFSLHPDQLGMTVPQQSPEHLAQMQLGYRDALMTKAEAMRFQSNPFDATLGTPAAEQRLGALYPDNPGNADLLRQRDLEAQLARTSTRVIGGSQTSLNDVANQQFGMSPLAEGALHAGAAMATHGASIPGTAARIAGASLKDRVTMGFGQRAVAKADDLVPMLLNADPTASKAALDQAIAQSAAYQQFVQGVRPTRRLGMFGGALGSVLGGRMAN